MKRCEECKFQLEGCSEEEKVRCALNNSTFEEKAALCEKCFLKDRCEGLFCGVPF
jgi:hypothetical protein